MQRAVRAPPARCVFEMDSMLVVNMVNGEWACRRRHLIPLLQACRDLGAHLSDVGCEWLVRHIYREYNREADEQSRVGLATPWAVGPSPTW